MVVISSVNKHSMIRSSRYHTGENTRLKKFVNNRGYQRMIQKED